MILAAIHFTPQVDLFPLLAGTLAAVGCGLLGNFLVLRRLSLMGDAISHSVLPGLVIAFLLTASKDPLTMFLGAAIAGVATVVLVEVVKKLGRVEPGAAMGVVFCILFAIGVLLIEKAAAHNTDLDADCVLHGQLEYLWWPNAPDTWAGVLSLNTLREAPPQIWTLLGMVVLAFAFTTVLFKELRLAAFDPALATTQGFDATLLHYLLMVFVAGATVASFEAVGSILVIAMLVCPAATARLMTDRLLPQIVWSVVVALVSGVGGYFAATAVPAVFEKDSFNAAGSISTVAGVMLAIAIVASPRHGVITRSMRRRKLANAVATDDLLASLYRGSESGVEALPLSALRRMLIGRPLDAAIARALRAGTVTREGDSLRLTSSGKLDAADIIRKHRLWEHYLVDQAGFAPDHVHETAEQLEHLGVGPRGGPELDPHGRAIPPTSNGTGSNT